MTAKVLLVSDDLGTGRAWGYSLKQGGVRSVLTGSCEEALALWAEDGFDLVVIDMQKSRLDGVTLCQQLRRQAVIPILLLTAQGDEAHVLEAYEAGVSECVVKPVSPALFLAKVQAWLCFSWTVVTEALDGLHVGGFSLDPAQRRVIVPPGNPIKLSNLEFRVLYLLMNHRGRALETDVIVERVWGYQAEDGAILLKNVIYRLRQKLEPDPARPRYIATVPGVGYVFQPE
jgi:two-component system response regulator VicR